MDDYITISIRMVISLTAGSIIGFERTYHGRPAGMRTHCLVTVSSCLLMLLSVFQWGLIKNVPVEYLRIDPVRMAQGIMTGIGFLGAGVIMKEKFSIRGLTTAASIWITASIGIIIGMGLYFTAILSTVFTLIILGLFGKFEQKLPAMKYGKIIVQFRRGKAMEKEKLEAIIATHKIKASNPIYNFNEDDDTVQFQFTVYTRNASNFYEFGKTMEKINNLKKLDIIPTGE